MFAFELIASTSTKPFTDEIALIGLINSDSRLAQIAKVFAKYYAFGYFNGDFCGVYRLDDGTVMCEPYTKLLHRLSGTQIEIDGHYAKTKLGLKPKARKSEDKTTMVLENLLINLYNFCFSPSRSLHEKIIKGKCGIIYQPAGLLSIHNQDKISRWYNPFFFPDPYGRQEHSKFFCRYKEFYAKYWQIIKATAARPLESFHIFYPETLPIKWFFQMLFCLCAKNRVIFNYVNQWIAHLLYSGRKAQTALIFYSDAKGVGKSLLTTVLHRLLGRGNFRSVGFSDFFKNNFKGDYLRCQLMVIEEMADDGQKKNRSSQKDDYLGCWKNLVTNCDMSMEGKYEKAEQSPNFTQFILTLNYPPTPLIELGDRRNIVIKCDESLKQHSASLPYDSRPYTVIQDKIVVGCNKDWTDAMQKSKFAANLGYKDCECEQETQNLETNYSLAYLSLVYLEIFQNSLDFVPHNCPPLTKWHVDLQLQTNKEVAMGWEFFCLKSNRFFGSPQFKCVVNNCQLSDAEHFDPEIPDNQWQTTHVSLEVYMPMRNMKSMNTGNLEKIGVTVERTLSITTVYSFPFYSALKEKLEFLLDLPNHTPVFEMDSYFST